MRLLITGGTGVLGRALRPVAEAAGHEFAMPSHEELDLFDASAVADAVRDVGGVLHLATRIRLLEQISDPDASRENDRLRADTPIGDVLPILRSALAAEEEAERFTRAAGWHPAVVA